VSLPLLWFPKLAKATPEQLSNWELLGDGEGIHWPERIKSLVSIAAILNNISDGNFATNPAQ
jgi:hypothetical protein